MDRRGEGDGGSKAAGWPASSTSFAADLARSVFTLLRNGLVDSLLPFLSTPPPHNAYLHQTHLLRDLRWYQGGLNQIVLLARAERSTLVTLCLDLMPVSSVDGIATPKHVVSHQWLSYDNLATALALKSPNEMVSVRA